MGGVSAVLMLLFTVARWPMGGKVTPVETPRTEPARATPPTPSQRPDNLPQRREQIAGGAPRVVAKEQGSARLLATARVIEAVDGIPGEKGASVRRVLAETKEKYPFVIFEERRREAPNGGGEENAGIVAMAGDHVLVRVRDEAAFGALQSWLAGQGAQIVRPAGGHGLLQVRLERTSLAAFDRLLEGLRRAQSAVAVAEPDYMVFASYSANDPSFGQLWGLNNTGQTGGVADADIDAPEAWDISRGADSLVVGVIDTGVDYNHPDLAANCWVNTKEIAGNGLDDDGNGYVDDYRGWNFVAETNDSVDDHYHGTHCAGTIGAVGDNGIGVAGVAHRVKIMALKFLSSTGSGYVSDAVEAVRYAAANGAKLTSNSWGGGGYSQLLKDAIDEAQGVGVLFVAAAGNESSDSDAAPSYPAAYDCPNIISVAATDHADQLAYFSNFGAQTVDLGAPGVDIYSTSPQSGYRSLSGTSMACPHVAGACVLLYAANPAMGWRQVKAALLDNADAIPALAGKTRTGGRLNVGRALIVSAGPYVATSAVLVNDGRNGSGMGNGDGGVNPGEEIALVVTMRNMGNEPAEGVSSSLRLDGAASGVTLLRSTQSWGLIASGATATNATTPFRFKVAGSAPTPQRLALQLTTTDTGGHTWNATIDLTIYTISTVRGRVTALADGAPVTGAAVRYTGPFSGSTTTDASGNYQLTLLDGTYQVSVRAAGFNPPEAQGVIVPGNRTGVDFALGRSRIQVSPASLEVNQYEDQITSRELIVSNTGDHALTVSLGVGALTPPTVAVRPKVSTAAFTQLGERRAAAHATNPPRSNEGVAAVTTLPFRDGFESGTLSDWTTDFGNGTRTVTAATSAVGTMSFKYEYSGTNSHFNGIHRDFAAGSRPRSVSFWVRTATTNSASGYFVLMGDYRDVIWFFADENGCFYVNADSAGDNTVPYQAETWYHVEFRNLDWSAKTFDYYVDGALKKAGIPFRDSAATQVSGLYLYNFSPGTTAWWDDIRVSDQGADWLQVAPADLTLQPGQSATVTATFDSTNLTEGSYAATLELYSNDPANSVINVPIALTVRYAPNAPPVADAQTVPMVEDCPAIVTLTGRDADNNPLNAFVTQLPERGILYQTTDGTTRGTPITAVPARVTHASWKLLYEPAANANGTEQFQFVLKDKRSQSNTATVSLAIAPVNDAPLAYNDWISGLPGQGPIAILVLANDTDPDGDALTIGTFTQPVHGTLSRGDAGVLIYTPASGAWEGNDSFTYTISDGHGATASATVAVNVGYLEAGDWPTLGNGPAHTGFYPASLGGKSFVANWTAAFPNALNPVAIMGGKVFVSAIYYDQPYISAIDLATGLLTWRRRFAAAHSITGPSCYGDRIYLQRGNHSSDSQLLSLDAGTGATVWSAPFEAQWEDYLPPAVTADTVFINGGYYGGIYGFNRTDGTQRFFQTLPQEDEWTPTVGTTAVYSCTAGVLASHNLLTGAKNWTLSIDPTWTSAKTVAFDSHRVFVAGSSGLYAIDVSGALPVLAWKATGGFTGIPAVANGRVYALASSGCKVQAFNAVTGSLIGDYLTGTVNCTNQPLVTNDALLASMDGSTFVFNLATRVLQQTISYGGYLGLANGALVISGRDGVLRCYRLDTGSNPPPVALSQTVVGVEDSTVPIVLGGNDANGDPLVAIVTSLPAAGTLYQTTDGLTPGQPVTESPVRVTNPERRLVYRPAPDGFGPGYSGFTFKVNDGVSNSAEAAVTIDISGVNDAPVANADHVTLRPRSELAHFWPTANDFDADGEVLTVASFGQPPHGTVTREVDGSLRYVPAADFLEGTDTFAYTVSDASGTTSSATVTITVSESFGRDWPTFGGGPDHTGNYPGLLGTDPLVLRWQFNTGQVINPVAVAEGKVFCSMNYWSDYRMRAYALDATTGALVWRTQFNPGSSLNPPSYHAGAIYLQRCNSSDTQLIALDAREGTIKWQVPHDAQWESYMAPAVSDLGVFINGGTYGGLYGFELSGAQRFFQSLEQYDDWTPTLYNGGVYTFVKGVFRAHNPASGAVLWSQDLSWNWAGYSMNRTVACAEDRAFLVNDAATGSKDLVAIDLSARSVAWKVIGAFSGTPAVVNGTVFVLSGNSVKTFGAAGGHPLGDYTAPAGAILKGAPVVAGDLVFAGSSGSTYIFNRGTRALLQTLPFGSEVAIADDTVYLACSDNAVRAYCHVPAENSAPVAQPIQATILEEANVTLKLEATDDQPQPLRFVIRSLPAQGALFQTTDGVTKGAAITEVPMLVQDSQSRVIYQAPLDANGRGVGTFTFSAHDPYTTSNTATVQISLTPVNDPPVAIPDTVALRPGETLRAFHPEANDRDADGEVLAVVGFTQGSTGTVSQNPGGSLNYVPHSSFTSGTDTFTYSVRDAAGVVTDSAVTVVISSSLGRDWPTFGCGPEHTAYQPIQLGSANFAPLWSNNLGNGPYQIAVMEGRAYVSGWGASRLFTLDLSTGMEVWRVDFAGYSLNAPTAFAGNVYLQCGNGGASRLFALNGADGTIRWSSPFTAQWESYLAPAIDGSGIYINGGTYGGLYGYDKASGAQRFFQSMEQYDDWTPALHSGGLYSFVKGVFRAHDPGTGAVLWSIDQGWKWAGYSMNRTVACANDRAYFVNDPVTIPYGMQDLVAVDLVGRKTLWKVRDKFTGTPAVAHQAVFAVSEGRFVKAYDETTGRHLGTYQAPAGESGLYWQPIITNDTVIAYSPTKTYLFDLRTRLLRHTIDFGGYVSLAGHELLIASSDGYVRAFAVADPNSTVDTDADGLPDSWEQLHFGGLARANGTTDSDDDGASDLEEFVSGTDPLDAGDVLRLACRPASTGIELIWLSKVGRFYQVEESVDLLAWSAASDVLEGTGASMTLTRGVVPEPRRFYRIRVIP